MTLAADIPVGETPIGKRNIVPITGGTFDGPGLRGKIMPGGWDWQLTIASGCFDLHADYMIQTDDSVIIHVVNQGMVCPNSSGQARCDVHNPDLRSTEREIRLAEWRSLRGTVDGMKIDGKPGCASVSSRHSQSELSPARPEFTLATGSSMNILVLGKGKTGTLVAEVARERGHGVRASTSTKICMRPLSPRRTLRVST